MGIVQAIKNILPAPLIIKLHNLKESIYQSRLYRHLVLDNRISRMRKQHRIHVLFISCSASMWKTDSLYLALKKHPRFNVKILISPNLTIQNMKLRSEEFQRLKYFFDSKGYPYEEWCDVDGNTPLHRIPTQYSLLFYPQPYPGMIPKPLDFPNHMDRLLIGCEYAFHSSNQHWAYDKFYQNAAFLDCVENETVRELASSLKRNKGINSVVTGLSFIDDFFRQEYSSPWKKQQKTSKKIIWATHWSIEEGISFLPAYSNFLAMADGMLRYAQSQIGQMQFAFKPHPWLKRELYKHPDWGKERTDAYYQAWQQGVNTQLEQGEYVDLFMTSDAMIHDCSSFCCEYLFTGKPVLFMMRDEERQVSLLNEMSHAALYAHYIGRSPDAPEQFLRKQVSEGFDPKKDERARVATTYLIPPNGKSAAENIIAAILDQLPE